ncbi:oxysterol-binding protein-related protein 8-like isoform X2 [Paramacrobiotus metropolitanus]|uniref:oxysterol-binding protein-related protein 8-like isoform X2 n=1 Tax=Paramacrobiotus metropolitanus TaxID=2943436 RepID=UPI002445A6CD|nr:oxysterol-binding protein-related protein 8-like isoform X2 [Paramacrobiotus metropolitanus]
MTEKPTRDRTGSVALREQREELEENLQRELSGVNAVQDIQTSNSARKEKLRDDSSGEGPQGAEAGHYKLARTGTYKEQKRLYKEEKKRVTDEVMQILSESTFLIDSGWLKARTTIKTWTKVWCELKPGGLILYKNERLNETTESIWVGTILLNICRIIERPSKKEGFCFKIYHPLDQNIWTNKGPHGETFGMKAFGVPLPVDHVIFRAANDLKGREWLSEIELVVKHSPDYFTQSQSGQGTLKRDGVRRTASTGVDQSRLLQRMRSESDSVTAEEGATQTESPIPISGASHWNDTDSQEEDDEEENVSGNDSSNHNEQFVEAEDYLADAIQETSYVLNHKEELGQHGKGLEEKLPEEERSLFWHLLLQVRPGMDLSKVVLPTFILDPRSLLDKLSDYYYHADLLSKASQYDSPFERMKGIVVWYLSGFYKKPKGVKKPYNPILGEVFRCAWEHPEKKSRTFYVAEQVSHHPPISAFYVSNRQEGFTISGAILTKSKYKGNSILAILDGSAKLKLLSRGEEYIITMPHLICKGMLFGKLSMDLGGKVTIACATTGYSTELNFSVWLTRTVNPVEGRIKLGNEVMATLQGSWDGEMFVTDMKLKSTELCWKPIPEARLNRLTVTFDRQSDFESEKLWSRVTAALAVNNQLEATHEKTFLEDNQREQAKERLAKKESWIPRLFAQDENGEWCYRYADFRPWDPLLDLHQFENDFCIQTKTRHQGPLPVGPPMEMKPAVLDGTSEPIRITKAAVRHGSKARRRNIPNDSDTSSDGIMERNDSSKSALISGATVPRAFTADKLVDSNLWPAIQALQVQQSQILSELQGMRPVIQRTVSHSSLECRLDSLIQKFQFFLWSAAVFGIACCIAVVWRIL